MALARRDGDDILVTVYAQPRASRDEVAGPHGDALRIRIAAPPVDGEANKALCRYIAGLCGVPASAVSIAGGETSRRKVVRVRCPARIPDVFGIPPQDTRTEKGDRT